jgi:UDPglucose 6-dehydrogenase
VEVDSTVAIIGTGYVGLTTGAAFSKLGHHVVCVDVDADKVAALQRGEIPIHEPGLADIVREGLEAGRLSFTTDIAAGVATAGFAYLCVPTPQGPDGSADLSYLVEAAREIAPHLPSEAVVVNKSTVPVGSTRIVEQALDRPDLFVVSNPEFLREGSAVHDFLNPDRIVIGSDDQGAAIRVASLYLGVPAPLMVTDPASAEAIKYASNAFLAMKLSYVNAIAALCEAVGADADDVMLGMGYDTRIGNKFLRPGPGWGGSCFPKDTRALRYLSAEAGYQFRLLDEVLAINDAQFGRVVDKVSAAAGGALSGARIGVWGLTFKANTDDRRDSPAVEIVRRLVAAGAHVVAHDPTVTERLPEVPEVAVVADPYAACEGAQVLAVLTEWDTFKWVDLDKVASVMAARHVVDARNLLDRGALVRRGFTHEGIGR